MKREQQARREHSKLREQRRNTYFQKLQGPGVRKVWQLGVDRQAEMNACGESWGETEGREEEPEKIIDCGLRSSSVKMWKVISR